MKKNPAPAEEHIPALFPKTTKKGEKKKMVKEIEYWNPLIETMPHTELKELQTKKLLWMLRYAYLNSPFYHRLYDEANVKPEDIKTIDEYRKRVPFYKKDDIREQLRKTGDPFGGILAVPPENLIMIHPSTGTTGLNTFMPFTRNDYERIGQVSIRNCWMAKMRPKMKVVANPIGWHWYAASYQVAFLKLGVHEYVYGCIPHALTASHMFNAITRFKPEYCIAVLDVILGVNDVCRRLGMDPIDACDSLNYTLGTMGEAVTKKLRQTLQDTWGLEDLFDAGGIGDGLYALCDCRAHDGFHSWEDLYHIELIDDETQELLPTASGERGEYLVSNLFHTSHPYVRFATEDYAEIFPEKCECGRTHERIRVFGRTGWILHVADKKISTYDVHQVLEKLPEMPEATFTMIKYADEMDELRLQAVYDETKTKDPEDLKQRAEEALKKELGVKAVIEWVTFEEIPKIWHKIQRLTDLTKEA
ncbi:MAG: phenylacetate--CoA ligase family protein [Candidatus Lokiarchaeia archaeon]